MPQPTIDPSPTLKNAQILVAALVMGLLSFSGVVVMLVTTGAAPAVGKGIGGTGSATPPPAELLLGLMGGLTIVCAVAGFVMRGVIIAGVRRRYEARELDESQLFPQFMTLTILRAALAEGPALFGTVIVLITGNWLGFIGTGVGLVLLLLIFPTRDRFDGFVRDVTGSAPGM